MRERPWVDCVEVLPVVAAYFPPHPPDIGMSPAAVPQEIDLIDPKSLLRVGPETVREQR